MDYAIIISTLLGSSAGTLLIREVIAHAARRRQRAREDKAREDSWLSMVRKYESPQTRVGSCGANSMPPQQRNSIEMSAAGV